MLQLIWRMFGKKHVYPMSLFAPKNSAILPVNVHIGKDLTTIAEANLSSFVSPVGLFVALSYEGVFFEAAFADSIEAYKADMQMLYPALSFSSSITELDNTLTSLFNPSQYSAIAPVEIALSGTDFQVRVWQELLKLPFGHTESYSETTAKLGDMGAIRAVGAAIGQNKLAYIVPCHRVVTKNGMAHNFKWGIETKKKILSWEYALSW